MVEVGPLDLLGMEFFSLSMTKLSFYFFKLSCKKMNFFRAHGVRHCLLSREGNLLKKIAIFKMNFNWQIYTN
jgi:hypothetical protein